MDSGNGWVEPIICILKNSPQVIPMFSQVCENPCTKKYFKKAMLQRALLR